MKKEIFELLKKELVSMLIVFIIAVAIFKIAFFNEGFVNVALIAAYLFWLFAIPGYFLMFYWRKRLGFLERFVIGFLLSAAVIGIASYYLGLMGLHVKYHSILLPAAIIAVSVFAVLAEKE